MEMMGGTINVESEVGKGSTFTVEISLKLQDIEKNAAQIQELDGLRALVVDDDFHICDSVSKMLKQIGMRSEWTTYPAGKRRTVPRWHMRRMPSILTLLTGRCPRQAAWRLPERFEAWQETMCRSSF